MQAAAPAEHSLQPASTGWGADLASLSSLSSGLRGLQAAGCGGSAPPFSRLTYHLGDYAPHPEPVPGWGGAGDLASPGTGSWHTAGLIGRQLSAEVPRGRHAFHSFPLTASGVEARQLSLGPQPSWLPSGGLPLGGEGHRRLCAAASGCLAGLWGGAQLAGPAAGAGGAQARQLPSARRFV